MDLLLYGDSIFESFLGTLMGQPNADWAGVADVWNKHHGGSKAKVLAISGMSMLQQQHMHAAAAALIMCRSCAVPIMCSAWLEHDHAYSSRRCISLHVLIISLAYIIIYCCSVSLHVTRKSCEVGLSVCSLKL